MVHKKFWRGRKILSGVILTAICLVLSSCAGQTGNRPDVETEQIGSEPDRETMETEETDASEDMEPLESPEQKAALEEALRETLMNQQKTYTFREVSSLLYQQGLCWEAYYNVSGEKIVMYWEDGTELMFLCPGYIGLETKLDEMFLVMVNDCFFPQGFEKGFLNKLQSRLQSRYQSESLSGPGAWADLNYYPQTAEYYISDAELMEMNETEVEIALQEIYARHGKKMEKTFFEAVFCQKTWYAPEYDGAEFSDRQETLLNQYEKENVGTISANKKKRRFLDSQETGFKIPRSVVEGSRIDLDGDGLPEEILYDFMFAGPYEVAKEYWVMINPKVPGDFKITGEIDEMPLAICAASLDGKTSQLIMSGKMDDGKPRTDIYCYRDGKAVLAGQIDANNLEIMEDCFWAYQYDQQQIYMERAKYIYENGKVVETGVVDRAVEGDGNSDNRMRTLIDSFDFERSRIVYSEVAAALEHIEIGWESSINGSRERQELICDDGTVMILMSSGLPERELIMAGDRLSEEGFQRVFVYEQVAEPWEYYYPQTAESILTDDELFRMNQTELYVARNEIYARHGRRFVEPFLNAVFCRKSWYQPKYSGAEFSDKVDLLFNEYEKENLNRLVAAEKLLK